MGHTLVYLWVSKPIIKELKKVYGVIKHAPVQTTDLVGLW